MHEGRASDPIMQRRAIHEISPKCPCHAEEEVGIFDKAHLGIKAADTRDAITSHDRGAAYEHRGAKQYPGCEGELSSVSAKCTAARRISCPRGKEAGLVFQLLGRAYPERLDPAEHEPHVRMPLERGLHGGIVTLRHDIIVVEKMNIHPARARPTQVAHDRG